MLDLRHIRYALLAQLALQLLLGDELRAHIFSIHFALVDQNEWRGGEKPFKNFEMIAQPIQEDVPKHDGEYQQHTFSNGFVLLREPVLSGIGNQDDDQDVGYSDRR